MIAPVAARAVRCRRVWAIGWREPGGIPGGPEELGEGEGVGATAPRSACRVEVDSGGGATFPATRIPISNVARAQWRLRRSTKRFELPEASPALIKHSPGETGSISPSGALGR